jgi:hypothetical protein
VLGLRGPDRRQGAELVELKLSVTPKESQFFEVAGVVSFQAESELESFFAQALLVISPGLASRNYPG